MNESFLDRRLYARGSACAAREEEIMKMKTKRQTAAKTHIQTRNGRTTEISDADFKRLSKTGKTKVTDLRTGDVLIAEVTHWRVSL